MEPLWCESDGNEPDPDSANWCDYCLGICECTEVNHCALCDCIPCTCEMYRAAEDATDEP